MNKYFFDLVGDAGAQYDHRGRELASPEKAFQMAELIALDWVSKRKQHGKAGRFRSAMRSVNNFSRCR